MARPFESTTDKIMREAIEAQRGLVPFGSVSALDKAAQDAIKISKAMEDALGGSTAVAKAAQDALRSQKLMEETLGGSTAVARAVQDALRSQKLLEETLGVSRISLPPVGPSSHMGGAGSLLPAQPKIERNNQPIRSATDLAPLIRKARKRMGMNQQAFADYAGVGRRFLSELENGKASLEFDKVLACARTAGIDIFAKPRQPL
jgi:y4mF family transcriptional regulator